MMLTSEKKKKNQGEMCLLFEKQTEKEKLLTTPATPFPLTPLSYQGSYSVSTLPVSPSLSIIYHSYFTDHKCSHHSY